LKNLVEDRVTDYLRSLIPPYDEKLQNLARQCRKAHVPIVEPEVAQLLLFLVSSRKPKKILEIGTAVGYSSILMGRVIRQYKGSIATIERNRARYLSARKNIENAGLDEYINLIYGDASDILIELKDSYDMVFLDAAKGQYLNFYPEIYRLLLPGGILVADNVLYRGLVIPGSTFHRRKKTMVCRLRKFLQELNTNPSLTTTILPIGDGVAIAYKEGDMQNV
jgi:predicted O-methyltransferase YrrM